MRSLVKAAVNSVMTALSVCTIVDTEMCVTFYLCPADYSNNVYVAVAASKNLGMTENCGGQY